MLNKFPLPPSPLPLHILTSFPSHHPPPQISCLQLPLIHLHPLSPAESGTPRRPGSGADRRGVRAAEGAGARGRASIQHLPLEGL